MKDKSWCAYSGRGGDGRDVRRSGLGRWGNVAGWRRVDTGARAPGQWSRRRHAGGSGRGRGAVEYFSDELEVDAMALEHTNDELEAEVGVS
jgi:hypothetical protein